MKRDKIITLIAEDMKHSQLLNGLESISLNDNDKYALSIDVLVAEMMGYPQGKVPDTWLEIYHKTMLSIPNNLTPREAHSRATILFDTLSNI